MSEKKVMKKKSVAKPKATKSVSVTKKASSAKKASKPKAALKRVTKKPEVKTISVKAKKVSAKKVKKPVAKKATASKQDLFNNCPTGKEFILCNDDKVSSVLGLAEELGKIDVYVYMHHVNDERNDFSNWIADVFEAKDLAKKIRHLNMHDARIEIYKYLINYLKR